MGNKDPSSDSQHALLPYSFILSPCLSLSALCLTLSPTSILQSTYSPHTHTHTSPITAEDTFLALPLGMKVICQGGGGEKFVMQKCTRRSKISDQGLFKLWQLSLARLWLSSEETYEH